MCVWVGGCVCQWYQWQLKWPPLTHKYVCLGGCVCVRRILNDLPDGEQQVSPLASDPSLRIALLALEEEQQHEDIVRFLTAEASLCQ